jgi:hypothetical protein
LKRLKIFFVLALSTSVRSECMCIRICVRGAINEDAVQSALTGDDVLFIFTFFVQTFLMVLSNAIDVLLPSLLNSICSYEVVVAVVEITMISFPNSGH